jgi:hypothetical protein
VKVRSLETHHDVVVELLIALPNVDA